MNRALFAEDQSLSAHIPLHTNCNIDYPIHFKVLFNIEMKQFDMYRIAKVYNMIKAWIKKATNQLYPKIG